MRSTEVLVPGDAEILRAAAARLDDMRDFGPMTAMMMSGARESLIYAVEWYGQGEPTPRLSMEKWIDACVVLLLLLAEVAGS